MPSELDQRFDAVLAMVTGPGGRVVLDRDGQGRAIVANFPPTLPMFFRTFCGLYADREALISEDMTPGAALNGCRVVPAFAGGAVSAEALAVLGGP